MKNELLTIGPFTVYGYGLMIAIGILAGCLTAEYRAGKQKLDSEQIFPMILWCLVGGFFCAKLLFWITEWKSIVQDPGFIMETLSSGFVVFGGIIGGILTGLLYCRIRKLVFFKYADVILPSVALAQGFGRIGCFLAGCCYGKETESVFSVIFQNFSFFSASVAQNIMLDLQWDKTELYDALEQSLYRKDPYLKRIPLDTCMTKEFNDDGIILSGGQAQKLVITRAFLKPPFVLMDEPSSELDVSSERELNELILQNSRRKGILIIAHRLTTTRRADRILVLSHGKKVEEGSHEELMRQKGHYYRMFMAQAKQYQEN